MHVLVTGAASFTGSHFLKIICEKEFRITATYRNRSRFFQDNQVEDLPVDLVQMDLADPAQYARLPVNIDAIVHLAGLSPGGDITSADYIKSNVESVQNLSRYARHARAQTLIYSSTMSVYGNINDEVVDANTKIDNPDIYGVTKYLGEKIIEADVANHHYSAISIRLPLILGANAHRHWLSQVLDKAKRGETIEIYNPDEEFNNAVSIRKLSDFIIRLLKKKLSGYHVTPVASEGAVKIIDLVRFIIKELDSVSDIKIVDSKLTTHTISNEYAMSNLGYRPENINACIQEYIRENR